MALSFQLVEQPLPAVGVVVLQTDELVELELGSLCAAAGVRLYVSRIPMPPEVTPETLASMGDHMAASATLLPTGADLKAVAYACTSGATVLGERRVADLVKSAHPKAAVTNPMSALKAACSTLGIRRLAMVTPYTPTVSSALIDTLGESGITVTELASFEQSEDAVVARIDPDSVRAAVLDAGSAECDAVFASCTNLRAWEIAADAERELGKPVLCSNQVLGWHLLQLIGFKASGAEGRLFIATPDG